MLTMNQKQEVLLNNEPIVDWYKKRDILPVDNHYSIRTPDDKVRLCLVAAIGFAHYERSINSYLKKLSFKADMKLFVSKLTKIPMGELYELELGFLTHKSEMMEDGHRYSNSRVLGYEARVQLLKGFDLDRLHISDRGMSIGCVSSL